MEETHDPYAALRHGGYRCLLGGSVIASMGAEVLHIAVGWELYQRTNDPAFLGYAGLAQFLPVLLLSLPAGQALDRYSRKGMLQGGQTLMALAALTLAYLSLTEGPIPLIFVCLAVVGVARAIGAPARGALVSQVVPAQVLGNAVSWNSTAWQFAMVSGPAVGGFLLASLGARGPALSYCTTAGAALACVLILIPIRPRAVTPTGSRSLQSLLAGVKFVLNNDLLLAAITLDLFAVLLGGATALLPLFARDILEVGPVGLGRLRAAPAVGALFMGMVLAHRPPLRRPGWALVFAVSGFGLATIGFGLSRDPVLSLALLALLGAFDNISVVVRGTLVQMLTPDAMRGRVGAVNLVFISSSNELGGFESGMTAAWFGPVRSVVGGGIGTLLVVAAVVARFPPLLRLGPLHQLRAAPMQEEVAEMLGESECPRLP